MRRKGELSPSAIDRGWPHQVALPASDCAAGGFETIDKFYEGLSLCPRGLAVFYGGQWFNIYCFEKIEDAETFMRQFGGGTFDPKQRGKGSNWARWNR